MGERGGGGGFLWGAAALLIIYLFQTDAAASGATESSTREQLKSNKWSNRLTICWAFSATICSNRLLSVFLTAREIGPASVELWSQSSQI